MNESPTRPTALEGPSPQMRPPPDRRFVRALFDWLEPNYESAVLVYTLGLDLRWKWELLHRLRPREGERALDLACGTGLIYRRLVRRVGSGSVVGLDLNRAMLLHARRSQPDTQVVRADSVRLPFRDASFDLVTAGYLFKYVPLDLLGSEIKRVLKPGGRFGGYDFSAPLVERPSGWIYARYLHRVLPQVGRWRARGVDQWGGLFGFLSQIAAESGWEIRVEGAFHQAGFRSVGRVASLGGAITWFWAWS